MAFSTHAGSCHGSRGVGESLILKRRQREDHLASYVDCVKGLDKANLRAEWEHSLHVRSEGTHVQRALHRLKNQHESQLHSRRLKCVIRVDVGTLSCIRLYAQKEGAHTYVCACLTLIQTRRSVQPRDGGVEG